MFTHSHANMPLGQSERTYYLSYFINIYTTFIGWCEGEECSIPLEVEQKQSKGIGQRSVVTTLSFTPVGDLQVTDRSNLL